MMTNSFEDFLIKFEEYIEPYLNIEEISSPLRIKKEHTYNVIENGKIIMQDLPEKQHFASLLACLYHDIGRFEQMRIYKTFHDPKSCNHAMLGLKVLKEKKIFENLDEETKKIVNISIALHNRYIFPEHIDKKYKPVSFLLRDADKIDIMRVMVENFVEVKEGRDTVFLHVKDEPYYTKKILASLLSGKAILYSDLVYVNDFRLLLGGWLKELHYKKSRQIIKERKHIDIILKDLPKCEDMASARDYIYSLLEQ